jgi:hypothetical protein
VQPQAHSGRQLAPNRAVTVAAQDALVDSGAAARIATRQTFDEPPEAEPESRTRMLRCSQ